MTDCKHLVQQRIITSEQNTVFAQSDGERRWCVEVLKSGYTSAIFVDMGAKVDGTYYCDLLLSQELLPVICHVSSEFVF